MKNLKLKVPSLIDSVTMVQGFVDIVKDKFNFDDNIYSNIVVSVTESVKNAIVHGNRSNKSKNVYLTMNIDCSNISVTVEDEGKGFDYNNLPDPTAPENIEVIGGRGIYIIKHLADEVNFSNRGKTITMTFYKM